MKKIQISISLPQVVLTELDCHINDLDYRSRAHIIHAIIVEWLNAKNKTGKKQTDIFETMSGKSSKKTSKKS